MFRGGGLGEERVEWNDERDVNVEQQAFCQQFVRFLVSQSVCFFTPPFPLFLSFALHGCMQTHVGAYNEFPLF
jgi:hypothetical protein